MNVCTHCKEPRDYLPRLADEPCPECKARGHQAATPERCPACREAVREARETLEREG